MQIRKKALDGVMPRIVRDFGKEVAQKQNCDNRTQVGKIYQ